MPWYDDLDAYVALPRTNALTLSPDGARLAASVSTLDAKKTAWVTSLWSVDAAGAAPASRLTRGAKGENAAAWTPAGDLLFLAKRPADEDDSDAPAALWLLPAGGGEPRVVATHPGGFGAVKVEGSSLVASATVLPGATTIESDAALRKARTEGKVAAILHAGYPVRFWDHDLGPGQVRLYAADLGALAPAAAGETDPRLELRDLTPDVGPHLAGGFALAPDGSHVVVEWREYGERIATRESLVRIELATGERTTLHAEEGFEFSAPVISPDSAWVAYARTSEGTHERAGDTVTWVSRTDGSAARAVTRGWDHWAGEVRWLPDSSGLVATADHDGRCPVWLLPFDDAPVRLTDEGAYSNLHVAPDGASVYALRASYACPNEVVRVGLDGSGPVVLAGPTGRPDLPGTLTEVETTAADGVRIRAWLCLPKGASAERPAPLVLWVHGGPLSSWNAWSWRWCPWLLVSQGYAVLLPDPALSTGYGHAFLQRGWGRWGAEPFTDLMAITDAVERRPDTDATRTAAMGGSFGGYMANWIAGHTDRFDAIVTHASLWALDQFGPTTDAAMWWAREMSPAMVADHSPHSSVGAIATPMLVIHGDKDYRVPIGEGLRLWYELLTASALPMDADGRTVHRFLYFPDENHWVLSPGHAKVWYEVVLGFLGEHVLGRDAPRHPSVLGLSVAELDVDDVSGPHDPEG
ncbi:prolyl oligopeptidase family serine peptidase [Propioniciclava sp.]|uniref:S9 family peptidase n=1 Tax=Propioniciclava sp. TaxID=2038686 RepID=UPI002633A320|nr:prolyl oligopeptidase family serine peptidase [Propioniciclava sp.]